MQPHRPDVEVETLRDEDVSTFNTRKRLIQLHEARSRVRDTIHQVSMHRVDGGFNQYDANTALRSAVESYVMETEWLIRNPTPEDDRRDETPDPRDNLEAHYWKEAELGRMELPDGRAIAFNGLYSILDAPNPVTGKVAERVQDPVSGSGTESQEFRRQIPRRVLMTAFRTTNRVIAELDMDIDIADANRKHSDATKVDPEEHPYLYQQPGATGPDGEVYGE